MIDILSVIPHRDPFLFVDEIVTITDTEIVAKKTFSLNNNAFYSGHYPSNPITPGVILCESVFQTAAVLLSQKNNDNIRLVDEQMQNNVIFSKNPSTTNDNINSSSIRNKNLVPVLSKIENARFKSIVRPGEELIIIATIIEQIGKFSMLSGVIKKNDNTVVLRMNFTLGYVEQK